MAYWRMQLHPAEPSESVKGCVESLAAGTWYGGTWYGPYGVYGVAWYGGGPD